MVVVVVPVAILVDPLRTGGSRRRGLLLPSVGTVDTISVGCLSKLQPLIPVERGVAMVASVVVVEVVVIAVELVLVMATELFHGFALVFLFFFFWTRMCVK